MKTIIQAKVSTHHNSTSLRNLNLKHYKAHGSGVHESWESFNTMKEAKEHLKGKDLEGVSSVNLLTGWERKDFIEGKEAYNVDWK